MEILCDTLSPLVPAVEFYLYTLAAEKWLLLLIFGVPFGSALWLGLIAGWRVFKAWEKEMAR